MFVLREVFETPYDEIAEAVGKAPAAVRQIARRAREHVAARRPRVQLSRAQREAVVERFLAAVRGGDLQGLLYVRASDVVVVSDGGGVVAAARRPIEGADRVGPLLGGVVKLVDDFVVMPMWLNSGSAVRFDLDGELNTVASLVIEDGQHPDLHDPQPAQAGRLDEEASLSR